MRSQTGTGEIRGHCCSGSPQNAICMVNEGCVPIGLQIVGDGRRILITRRASCRAAQSLALTAPMLERCGDHLETFPDAAKSDPVTEAPTDRPPASIGTRLPCWQLLAGIEERAWVRRMVRRKHDQGILPDQRPDQPTDKSRAQQVSLGEKAPRKARGATEQLISPRHPLREIGSPAMAPA